MSDQHCPNLIDNMNDINNTKKYIHVSMRWGRQYYRSWPSLVHLWSSWYREYYEVGRADRKHSIDPQTYSNSRIVPRLMIRFEDILFYPEYVVNEIRRCVGADWIQPSHNSSINATTLTTKRRSNRNLKDSESQEAEYDSYDYYSNFVHTAAPSKTHPYFARFKQHQSSLVSALIKYGSDDNAPYLMSDQNNSRHRDRKIQDIRKNGMVNDRAIFIKEQSSEINSKEHKSTTRSSEKGRSRRVRNMTDADIAFAYKYLDPTLLSLFQYNHPQNMPNVHVQ
jgi:hypothetical protein